MNAMNTPTSDRTELDRLRAAANLAIAEHDAIDDCFTPEWRAAHTRVRNACLAERAGRWGKWMTRLDRDLAAIPGGLTS